MTLDEYLECYYCGRDNPGECNGDVPGEEIHCQMLHPEEPHYGDSCFVGHSGKYFNSYQNRF